ncbi:helix-turn-helix domain-containing protein [Paenibacillus illinoisensis]|uniref:helix-turn-helix domain-containing protein n=1 Tax=Paenibacillus illinoisensis TaxID=59845 RepID=UPI0033417B97
MGLYPGDCRLQYLLDRAGMSQAELSRRTGLSPQYINGLINERWKRGVMKLDKARLICAALKIDNPFDLYEWRAEKPD